MSRLHVALMRDPHWKTFEERIPDPPTAGPDPEPLTSGAGVGDADLREFATTATSTVISRLLGRERVEWRRAIEGVRSALEMLELASDTAGPLHPAELAAEISDMVSGLMAAAARESLAAADRARAEARGTIEALESRLAHLEAESQQKLTVAVARQQEEHGLRLRAEEAQAEAERLHDEAVASYESRLEAARLRAEHERLRFTAVHEELTTCLEQAILLVHRHDGVTPAASLPSQSVSDASLADVFVQPEPRPYNENRSEDPARRGAETIASRDTNVRPAKGLALVTAHHEAAPEIVESIQQCLKETEAAYWADIAAKTPLEAVALLTANLRVTRAQLAARFAHHGDVVPTLFENQLLAELNAHGDTSYGRHLSISVRELYPVQGTAAVTSRVA